MATSWPTSWTLTGECMANRHGRNISVRRNSKFTARRRCQVIDPPYRFGVMNTAEATLPHLVVVGAGFGGLTFVQEFPANLARITIIDRQNHHLFQPLLYQVATAGLSAVDIAQPIRAIFGDRPNLSVIMSEVTRVDLAARQVAHGRGTETYDYLVLAAGSVTGYFGHPEWERCAPGLKTLDDALRIRRMILCSLERAETEPDHARRDAAMTIVLVGGGPTGVEMAGAIAGLTRTVV